MSNRDRTAYWVPIYGLTASLAVGFLLGIAHQIFSTAIGISSPISAILIFVAWGITQMFLTLFVPDLTSKLWSLANIIVLLVTYWVVVENFGIGGWGAA
jgi:hypothetical protein